MSLPDALGDEMFTTAMPNKPENEPEQPGGGGADGAIDTVTACGNAAGDA